LTDEAIKSLHEAHQHAVKENQIQDDQIRFKVQEMHLLNQIYHQYSNIQYKTENNSTWFDFSKTIRNNILVELNINSLSEVYDLNQQHFKDVIGSLNWKKFAERIKI
tara:strand:+ start:648 stop:968 length:321 start_codon:yes stop_codon:yes gene_type:complete